MNFRSVLNCLLATGLLSVTSLILLEVDEATATRFKPPNILFCIADDASYEHMSAYGFDHVWVNTPSFDRVAKEGLLFTKAYTPNAKCAPSRACILTGRNPWQLEEAANHAPYFPDRYVSVMEALHEHGYKTGFTGKGWAPGNPGTRDGHRRNLTGREYNTIKLSAPTRQMSPTDYTANFLQFLKEKPAEQPFCFWFGGHEPHRAYEFGSGEAKGKKNIRDIKTVPPYWPDNELVRNDMLDYAYELEYFDHHVGKMLDLLEKHGELENTIIIVTSDNGMPFPRVKGHVYEAANHLPLAIMWKKGIEAPGMKIDDMVSFIDFAPTFLEIAGLENQHSGMQPLQGESLVKMMRSREKHPNKGTRDYVLLGRERTDVGRPGDIGYPVRGIVDHHFLFTNNYEPGRWPSGNPVTGYLDTDGGVTKTAILQARREGEFQQLWELCFGKRPAEELYDLRIDPYCMNNLATNSAYKKRKDKLKKKMETALKRQQDPRMFGRGYVFDQYLYGEPKLVNFYGRFIKGEAIKAGWVSETDFEKEDK